MTSSRREWNTPVREPWNAVISKLLKAIDNHSGLFLKTGDQWHMAKAQQLREYVAELKEWIVAQEQEKPPL